MSSNHSNTVLTHLAFAAGGLVVGKLWAESEAENEKKSRSEREHPEQMVEVYEEIAPLLEEWEPNENCQSEMNFTEDLASFLDENSEWEIEVCPETKHGIPDILVGDLLALELKINPGKTERDRLIGQCAGYAQEWATWAVVINAPASRVGALQNALDDSGLDHILVWSFN
jgi:hypothetical protein